MSYSLGMRGAALPCALLAFSPALAHAADANMERKKQCIAAHVRAQELGKEERLREARKVAVACSADDCPLPVQSACVALARAMENAIPTLVVRLRKADGGSTSPESMTIDGAPVDPGALDKPIELDPGQHRLVVRFGQQRIEKELLVPPGEKRQLVTIDLAQPAVPPSPPAQAPRRVPTASLILAGVGAVGIGSFATFGLRGRSKESDLESCKPNCDESLRGPIERDYVIADISLAVGVVALGVGAWLAFSDGDDRRTGSPRWYVQARSQAPQFGAGARF